MERFTGLLGIVLILGIAYLLSNNRKAINYRLVGVGLALQMALAVFILKTDVGQDMFEWLGKAITKVLKFSNEGGKFVFGVLANEENLGKVIIADQVKDGTAFLGAGNVLGKTFGAGFIFFFQIIPTIIFVAALVNIFYHLGIMQKVIEVLAKGMKWVMNVSGAEALSNISSAFVGQVEAQIMIKPYLKGMTSSELMASMTGSFACISGGVMAAYIGMGVKAEYLIAASIMAAPGALVIAKIIFPETEESETSGGVKIKVEKQFSNLVDAISSGCSDGLKIGMNVLAMLIGFLALIALVDYLLGHLGGMFNMPGFSLNTILGFVFSGFAWCMGVPASEMMEAGALMGKKLVANEFVAYLELAPKIANQTLSPKTIMIVSFALCGFANFGSLGIQVGGISALEPSRRADLSKLAVKALIAGTLASYLSATVAGLLY